MNNTDLFDIHENIDDVNISNSANSVYLEIRKKKLSVIKKVVGIVILVVAIGFAAFVAFKNSRFYSEFGKQIVEIEQSK